MKKSKTRIELEKPYSNDFNYGHLLINRENRKIVVLVKTEKNRTTTSFARYLMATYLKRYLTKQETVDHINHDKTDDRLENLQILSFQENKDKYYRFSGKKFTKTMDLFECSFCRKEFVKEIRGWFKGEWGSRSCSKNCSNKIKAKPSKEIFYKGKVTCSLEDLQNKYGFIVKKRIYKKRKRSSVVRATGS